MNDAPPLRVLLVDDEDDYRVLVDDLLSDVAGLRFDLSWEPDWGRALATLLRNAHDVCLLDHRLGSRTGLDLLREARARGCRVPVVMFTSQAEVATDIEAMRAGASDYLVKGEIDGRVLERSMRYATERKRGEAMLVQAEKMATIGVLAGNIAHEVNNPIGIISAKARLLLSDPREPLSPRVAQELGKMVEQCDRLQQLTRSLLDFSRPSAMASRAPTDVTDPLEKALALVAGRSGKAAIEVRRAFEPDSPRVQANANELQQVFLNLLLNAVDAMPSGGRLTVTVQAEGVALERGQRAVAVRIADTGGGIGEEIRDRIFDPFFTTKSAVTGTGLGLTICLAIVQGHGGELDVRSGRGLGAEFVVKLPAARDADGQP